MYCSDNILLLPVYHTSQQNDKSALCQHKENIRNIAHLNALSHIARQSAQYCIIIIE